MWIERSDTKKIINAVKTRPAILLTGVRQAGKSSLLQRLFKDVEHITLDKILLAEEASEQPRAEKLNFTKVAPLFQKKVNCIVACNMREKGTIHLKNYSLYNPLFGNALGNL